MKTEDVETMGIIGSGTMGRGIAICTASAGLKTILYDIRDEILENAKTLIQKDLFRGVEKKKFTETKKDEIFSSISFTSEFGDLKDSDFIIEAALEDIEIKKDVFSKLDSVSRPEIILATNTSSLSVTAISTYVKTNPERVIGMHFFNPANIMKLVEVIKGVFTSDETTETTVELSKMIGKVPVIAKDTPAFIVNRIARPFYGEALKILSEGSAEVKTIDEVMKDCGGFAMGPFELMDLIGIDVNFSVTKSVYEAFFNDPKYRPSYLQKKMVDADLLGRKTKRGFYNYESKLKNIRKNRRHGKVDFNTEEFKLILNSRSQRITAPRLEILGILKSNHNPLTISEIHDKIKNKKTDLATVYRTINLFTGLRIVNEIDFKDEFKRYELIYDRHHHHHIVCKKCKRVENVEACVLEELEKFLNKKGYTEITHSLEFFGVCDNCRSIRY